MCWLDIKYTAWGGWGLVYGYDDQPSRKDPPPYPLTRCDLSPLTPDLPEWIFNGGQTLASSGQELWGRLARLSGQFTAVLGLCVHLLFFPQEQAEWGGERERQILRRGSLHSWLECCRNMAIYKASDPLLKLINTHNWRHPVILRWGLRKLFCGTLIILGRTPGYKYCQRCSLTPNGKL